MLIDHLFQQRVEFCIDGRCHAFSPHIQPNNSVDGFSNTNYFHGIGATLGVNIIPLGDDDQISVLHHTFGFENIHRLLVHLMAFDPGTVEGDQCTLR